MTASRSQSRWRRLAWAAPAALFVLAPKCLLCVAGYLGIAAALGFSVGPALCGGPAPGGGTGPATMLWTAGTAGALLLAATLRRRRRRRAIR